MITVIPPLFEQKLNGEIVYVWLWIHKGTRETGNDDLDTDGAQYDGIADAKIPEVIIQGGELEVRADKVLPGLKKLFKGQGRIQKRYERHDWGNKNFRIGPVNVFIGNSTQPT